MMLARFVAGALAFRALVEPAASSTELARNLYEEGAACREHNDYTCAIERWQRAYQSVPPDPEFAALRARLLFDLADAHARAYSADGDIAHLRRAVLLLQQYAADGGEGRALADEKLRALLSALHAHERAPAPRPPPPVADPPANTLTPPPEPGPAERLRQRALGTAQGLLPLGAVIAGSAVIIDGALIAIAANSIKRDPPARIDATLAIPYAMLLLSGAVLALGTRSLAHYRALRELDAGSAPRRFPPPWRRRAWALLAVGVVVAAVTAPVGASLANDGEWVAGHAVAHSGFFLSSGALLVGATMLAYRSSYESIRPPHALTLAPLATAGRFGLTLAGSF